MATPNVAKKNQPFVSDVQEIRRRAREHLEWGAVTENYGADKTAVIQLLNDALATETVCTLRYRQNFYVADGIQAGPVAEEFLEHANQEQEHADLIARRIRQLGGTPNLDPDTLASRSHAQYQEGGSLLEMIRENLVAERIAIESYREMIRFIGESDSTSRRLLESILETEEEHAEDLSSLLATLDPAHKTQRTAA